MKFYRCEHCGNIITFLEASGVKVVCCGDQMKELIPGTSDGAAEKHVPVIKREGNKVTVLVGEVPHPMIEEHYIQWVMLETKKGAQKFTFKPGDEPKAEFLLTDDDEVIAAYEYCNIHGLWIANA